MSFLELFLLAFGLSMDAFAVSLTNGMYSQKLKYSQVISVGMCFGGFQGMMPTIGYFLGMAFASFITSADHYIALILLGYIGGSMIVDSRSGHQEASSASLTASLLLVQGIATSIDALAVGVSLAALPNVNILSAASLIALVTFFFSVLGVRCGRLCGEKLGSHATLIGGVILVGIGVKIFVEHMFFA